MIPSSTQENVNSNDSTTNTTNTNNNNDQTTTHDATLSSPPTSSPPPIHTDMNITSSSEYANPTAEIEESVLKDILDQLEKERIKRAEVEAELFNLKKQLDQQQQEQEQIIIMKNNQKDDKKNNQVDLNDHSHNTHEYLSHSSSSSVFQEPKYKCNHIDDADRIHLINQMIEDFQSIEDSKKRNKRSFATHLSILYTKIQDTILEGISSDSTGSDVVNSKSKESTVKNEVNKVMSELNQKENGISWKVLDTPKSVRTVKKIIDSNTKNFIRSLERLSGTERMKEIEHEMEQMRNELITLRTEKGGYLDIIHALTPNNDAIAVASDENSCGYTLPLDVIQILEFMPWDERVSSHIKDYDFYHQWQVYDTKIKRWIEKIDLLPNDISNCTLVYKIGNQASKFQMENRTLPTNGTWEWVGNWKREGEDNESHHPSNNNYKESDMDWIYAEQPEYIKSNVKDKCFNEAFENHSSHDTSSPTSSPKQSNNTREPTRRYRRRIWKRQRVLVSYPGISRLTKQLLAIFAENARLSVTVEKLHDQVFQMQNQLTDKEEDMDKTRIELLSQLTELELENDKNVTELTKKSKECHELKKMVEEEKLIEAVADDKSKTDISEKQKDFISPIKSWVIKFPMSSSSNATPEKAKQEPTEQQHPKDSEDIGTVDTYSDTSSQAKLPSKKGVPLISINEGQSNNEDTTIDNNDVSNINSEKNIEVNIAQTYEDDNENGTMFKMDEIENKDEESNEDNKTKSSSVVEAIPHESSKVLQIIDPFAWRKINRESIMTTITKVKDDVEHNVQNVKTNVQAIAGRAHTFQKITNQVK